MQSVSLLELAFGEEDHRWWCMFQSPVMIVGWLWDKGMVWRRAVAYSSCCLWSLYRFMMVVVGLPWWIMFKI